MPKALITGASYGIGKEFSTQLAKVGYDLILVSRSKDKLTEVKNEVEKFNIKAKIISMDLSSPDAAEKLFNEVNEDIDILINNAGLGLFGEAIESNTKEVENIINLNIETLTKLSILFGKKMAEKGKGHILNIASMVALFPFPYFAVYSATKSFVLTFSLALRNELKTKGVNVSCLLPGFTKTNFDSNAKINSEKYKHFSNKMGMDATTVAKIGLKAMFKKKAFVIAGIQNKIFAFLIKILPQSLITSIVKKQLDSLV